MTKVLSFASKTKSCFLSKFHQYSMKKEERGLNQHSTGISLCISCPRIFCRKISSDCYIQPMNSTWCRDFSTWIPAGMQSVCQKRYWRQIIGSLKNTYKLLPKTETKSQTEGEFSFKRRPAISCSYEGAVTGSDSKSVNFPLTW